MFKPSALEVRGGVVEVPSNESGGYRRPSPGVGGRSVAAWGRKMEASGRAGDNEMVGGASECVRMLRMTARNYATARDYGRLWPVHELQACSCMTLRYSPARVAQRLERRAPAPTTFPVA